MADFVFMIWLVQINQMNLEHRAKNWEAAKLLFGEIDDVWSPAFLDGVVLQVVPNSVLSSDGLVWVKNQGVRHLLPSPGLTTPSVSTADIVIFSSWEFELKTGPYFAKRKGNSLAIREAYLMQHDKYLAFTQGVTPIHNSTAFEAVELYESRTNEVLVPVPSRLYSVGDTRADSLGAQ
ncbi:hypothetical protein BJY01DRAFT_255380 [Aspergillus pseudoustus]|uniref:Scytalone dehydratase-like protein Arp1 N-terminal domain-containing protein n=1 Tax=Aspergillus pseudoustus TaxID=1810923 RepID=A0ABR4IKP6_9EURO